MQLINYFNKGITFNEYLKNIDREINTPQLHTDFTQHTVLNQKRMQRLHKTFTLNEEQQSELAKITQHFDLLVISEAWCGDASQILPILNTMVNQLPQVQCRIVYRDQNIELMHQYQTNGSYAIPIVIGMNETGQEIFKYGPRPNFGTALLQQHKQNPEAYPKSEFYKDLQKAYNQDKGKTIYQDLLQLFKQA